MSPPSAAILVFGKSQFAHLNTPIARERLGQWQADQRSRLADPSKPSPPTAS